MTVLVMTVYPDFGPNNLSYFCSLLLVFHTVSVHYQFNVYYISHVLKKVPSNFLVRKTVEWR